MTYAVELREVSYRYPNSQEWSLRNINLSVEKGKFVAIMGPNGAGKTSFCLCLNGLIPQLMEGEFQGQAIVADRYTGKYRIQTLAQHIGLVLQDPEAQIFSQKVWEDVAFGPCNFSYPIAEIENRVNQALDLVHLVGFEHRNTTQLSGGERQRLALAGVLAQQPEILVLDEPTAELDHQGRQELYKAIDFLRMEKKLTVIMVEHSSDEILTRADEVIVLNKGEIAWQGKPSELFSDLELINKLGLRPPSGVLTHEALKKVRQGTDFRGEWKQPGNVSVDNGPIIEVKNLTYAYGQEPVLQGIDLQIYPGEFIVFIGANGAGKTTLLKHFNGLLKPFDGDVIVAGMNTKEYPVYEFARKVGYLGQNPDHQIFATTVEKEIAYGLNNIGLEEYEIAQRINEALRFTGLEKVRNSHPFTLSKGDRQLLAVTSIIALKPKILLVDEPTAGLDWISVQKLMTTFRQLHEAGTTIIMISHDLDLVEQYASRIVEVRKDESEEGKHHTKQMEQGYEESFLPNRVLKPQMGRILHRLEVRTKAVIFLALLVFAYLFDNPFYNLGTTMAIVMFTLWSGVRPKRIISMLIPLIPVLILMFIGNATSITTSAFDTKGRVLLDIWGYSLIVINSGLEQAVNLILRISMMVLATAFLTTTTLIDELVELLRKLRVPSMVAFAITTSLRFIPALNHKRIQILEAQEARGARLEAKGIMGSVQAYIPIMVPLLIYSILLTKSLTMAMLNRGFGFNRNVTPLRNVYLCKRDYFALGVALVIMIGVLYVKVTHQGI